MYTKTSRFASFFIIPLLLLTLPNCWGDQKSKESASAPVAAAPSFVAVNVLSKDLYDDCHVKGSINVPYEDLEEYATIHWNSATTNVVVYCANPQCTASTAGAKMLITKLGFPKEHVWAYEAGSAGAMHDKLPVEGPCKQTYLTEYEPALSEKEIDGVRIISSAELEKMINEFATH